MKMFSGKKALVGLFAISAVLSSCGATDDQSFLLGGRAKAGLDDRSRNHHPEQEPGDDNGQQHQERHRGGNSDDGARREQRFKNPGDQTSVAGVTVSMSLEKVRQGDDDMYKFEATGLPMGLMIDATTGKISGVVSAQPGVYAVIVTAKEMEETEDHLAAELKFNWTVTAQ